MEIDQSDFDVSFMSMTMFLSSSPLPWPMYILNLNDLMLPEILDSAFCHVFALLSQVMEPLTMGPQMEDYIETVVTCEGDFYDPEFHEQQLTDLKRKLQELIVSGKP